MGEQDYKNKKFSLFLQTLNLNIRLSANRALPSCGIFRSAFAKDIFLKKLSLLLKKKKKWAAFQNLRSLYCS